jgi:hypothetical protein
MNDSEFDDLLRTARGEVPLPDSFRHGVWQRVEAVAFDRAGALPWWRSAAVAVLRPWNAAAGLAATVALGLWLGAATAPEPEDTKTAYAESISPFAQAHRK